MAGRLRKRARKSVGRPRRKPKDTSVEVTREGSISSLDDSKDDDFVPSRYPTRYSTAILAHSPTLGSPVRNPVRNIMEINRPSNPAEIIPNGTRQEPISGNGDNAMLELLHCTSKQPHQDNMLRNMSQTYHKGNPSGSLNWSAPASEYVMNIDNFIFQELSSQCQQEVSEHDASASHHKLLTTYHRKISRAGRLEKSTQSRTHSINVTEYAKRLHDDNDPDEEVESALDPEYELVNGHRVKVEIAPLMRRIFAKHGDITARTEFESQKSLSNFLQQLCGVYKKLERTKFVELTRAEIDGMTADIRDCERVNLNVGWIHEKLDFISETWNKYEKYAGLKEEVGKYDAFIGSLEKTRDVYVHQLCELQRKITAVEEELVTKKAKIEPMRNVVIDTKARVKDLVKGTLVEGLL